MVSQTVSFFRDPKLAKLKMIKFSNIHTEKYFDEKNFLFFQISLQVSLEVLYHFIRFLDKKLVKKSSSPILMTLIFEISGFNRNTETNFWLK